MRSRVVTTTAVGVSTWLIQPSELNWQAAWTAETAPGTPRCPRWSTTPDPTAARPCRTALTLLRCRSARAGDRGSANDQPPRWNICNGLCRDPPGTKGLAESGDG